MRVEVSVEHVVVMEILHPLGDVQGEADAQGPGEDVVRLNQVFQSASTNVLEKNNKKTVMQTSLHLTCSSLSSNHNLNFTS